MNQNYNGDSYKEPLKHLRRIYRYPYKAIENKDSLPAKVCSKKEARENLRWRIP